MEKMLSLKEAATRKGVPPHAIERAVDEGQLNATTRGGMFFDAEEIDQWEPHPKSADGSDFTDYEAADYLRTPGTSS